MKLPHRLIQIPAQARHGLRTDRLAALEGQQYSLSVEEEARILSMGENFAEVWQSEHCPTTLKKMIFRWCHRGNRRAHRSQQGNSALPDSLEGWYTHAAANESSPFGLNEAARLCRESPFARTAGGSRFTKPRTNGSLCALGNTSLRSRHRAGSQYPRAPPSDRQATSTRGSHGPSN